MRKARALLIAIPLTCLVMALLGLGLYQIPFVQDRLSVRLDNWRAQVKYALNPPQEAIFIPQSTIDTSLQVTLQAIQPTLTHTPLPSPTITRPGPKATQAPTHTPSLTPTPLPVAVRLPGVKYEHQHNRWNYCGPANLSMALTFWGWKGDRDVVGAAIKPEDKDKNVMPYEMEDFVDTQVEGLRALTRQGGEISLVQRLVSAGFPVLAEKGYYEYDYNGKLGWMGHYQFITGYDEAQGVFIVQDTYRDGPDHPVLYADFITGWRSFNYIFLVAYPAERQDQVLALLGEWADPQWASQHALELAQAEASILTGVDQFFAWFNVGTSHISLLQYFDAAMAYDYAFQLYAALPDDGTRPYRMMWYQTGPYRAYYYTNRFLDVIALANTTLEDTISEPVLEESLYWRGMAKSASGDVSGAIQDFRDSLKWHPGFAPSLQALTNLGTGP
jgi:tetratricopeptide (TPR) repeat protein